MFVKFDLNGKVESFSEVASKDEILGDSEGFEFVDVALQDVHFVEKNGDEIVVNAERRNAERQRQAEIKKMLDYGKQLEKMEYTTSKRLDDEYTEEEWAEVVAKRRALRNQVRKLEQSTGIDLNSLLE